MNNFFSRLDITPEYLRIILLTEDDKYLSCGRVHIIKLTDSAKSWYVKEMVSEFRSFLQRYKAAGYKEIKIFYKPVTLEEYKEFKLKADKYMSKGKAHSVIDSLKLPKADSYSLWGRHEKITDTLFVVTKCTINKDIRSITIEKEETSNRLRVELKNGNIYIIQDSLVNGHLANRTLVRSNVKLIGKEPQLDTAKPKVPVDCSVTSLTPCFANLTLTQKSLRNIELSVKDVKETYQFITLDLETIIEDTGYGDKGMKLLSASIYDGSSSHSWYIGNYLKGNSYGEAKAAMVQDVFDSIFSYASTFSGNMKLAVYIHNGAKFDLVFLIDELLNSKRYTLECIYKEGVFITLTVNDSETDRSIDIRDSLLILNSSLAKIAKSFGIGLGKTMFPYSFPQLNNLDYIGEVPHYKYFDSRKVSLQDYKNYKSSFDAYLTGSWSLRKELLKYCENDCKVLYLVISRFQKVILDKFGVDIHTSPTLSSVAYKIFKANFLTKAYDVKTMRGMKSFSSIPVIAEINYQVLKEAYYGGHCDMYIPLNKDNQLIYCYDVNSLYPFVMKAFKYPVKFIAKVMGDVRVNDPELWSNTLGFYLVKVNCPKDLAHPILPVKRNGNTVFPTGSWTATYFSEEIKNAEKYGYTFDFMEGCAFEAASLFESYIDKLYDIKCNTAKSDPMYGISKLLLNSLYGRFGLNPNLGSSEFIANEDFKSDVTLQIEKEFKAHKLVTHIGEVKLEDAAESNVAIAAAVTAYARIHMSQFKNRSDFNLFYSDTDSVYIDKELPGEYISETELGKLKLEKTLTRFVGVGPKFYGGVDQHGNEFSKVKGYSSSVSVDQLESLLTKGNNLTLAQSKWYRDFESSNVLIKQTSYDSKITDNKRKLVFDDSGKMVMTAPVNLSE